MISIPLSPAPSNEANAVLEQGTRALRAISAEIGDYSQRLLTDGTTTASKLATAQSMPEAFNLMAAFSKRTFEEHMQQMSRMATMYTNAAEAQTRAFQAMMLSAHR